MKTQNFHNKTAVITGGTSGLGRALALQLKAAGARVAVIARHENQNPDLIGIIGDVSKKEQIYPLAGEIQTRLGDVDYLFNVASYLGETPLKLLIDTECEDFEQVLQTNLLGPFRLTKALLPGMVLRKQGVVINISSDAAINPYPRWGAYAVSKAGVDHMSRIFDEELKTHGVRFLSIDPGDMRTPMHFAAIPDANPEALRDPASSAEAILNLLAEKDFKEVRRSI